MNNVPISEALQDLPGRALRFLRDVGVWSLCLSPAPLLLLGMVHWGPRAKGGVIAYLVVWLAICCLFLWLPKLMEYWNWVDLDNAIGFYYKSGQLLVLFGCASAALVMHTSNSFLQQEFKDVGKLALLGFAALTGGALCADAILGADIEARRTQITVREATLATTSFLILSAVQVLILNGLSFANLTFPLDAVIAVALSSFPPLVGAFFASVKRTGKWGKWRAGLLFLTGILAVAIPVVSVFVVGLNLTMAGWGEISSDFLKEMLPAYGAAIGACFVARSIEITKPNFVAIAWVTRVSALAFRGAVINTESKEDGKVISRTSRPALQDDKEGEILLTVHDEVLTELESHGALHRNNITSEAVRWLTSQFMKDPKKNHDNYSCQYKLDKDFIKYLRKTPG
jgi:hypothetical protein